MVDVMFKRETRSAREVHERISYVLTDVKFSTRTKKARYDKIRARGITEMQHTRCTHAENARYHSDFGRPS